MIFEIVSKILRYSHYLQEMKNLLAFAGLKEQMLLEVGIISNLRRIETAYVC